ncbi:29137_t:CDS:2, partial [Gigaspora margarita]
IVLSFFESYILRWVLSDFASSGLGSGTWHRVYIEKRINTNEIINAHENINANEIIHANEITNMDEIIN